MRPERAPVQLDETVAAPEAAPRRAHAPRGERPHASHRPPQARTQTPVRPGDAGHMDAIPDSRRIERHRDPLDERVIGLGDHVPSFLLRPVKLRAHRIEEAEIEE